MKNKTRTTAANKKSFNSNYWNKIYGDGTDVDGTFNSDKHCAYLWNLFRLMGIPIKSICDIGFGKAVLLEEMTKTFQPEKIIAIDPSIEMVKNLLSKKWILNFQIAIHHSNFDSFDNSYLKKRPVDLLICNSVFQYMDKNIDSAFERLSQISRYVYFSVPTKADYERMKIEIPFSDPYAYSRTKEFYLKAMEKFFTIVSFNVLESKLNVKDSVFCDELYRF